MRGIYSITHIASGTTYVGQSVEIEERWKWHRNSLKRRTHQNRHLQNVFNKHGEESLAFVVLEECQPERLTEREQFWLDHFRDTGEVFNIGICAVPNTRGITLSAEHRAKIAKSHLGLSPGPEARAKIGLAHKGLIPTLEVRAKLSNANKGHPVSDETRAKISATLQGHQGWNKGGTISDERRAKLSLAKKADWARRKDKAQALCLR